MAIARNLRYYRGQYSPEEAYSSAGGDAPIISMYNPDVQNQFIDAVAKRQERFDTAKMAEAAEIARIGETETYDLAELNNRLKSFEAGINDIVKNKYNGDYGAAANEIAKKIGTERSNPFYHFNKQKVEMGKAYLDAKMKLGANFLSTNTPFDVSFEDWQNGKSFEFTPINRNDIVENSAAVFGTLAKTIFDKPDVSLTPDEKLMKITIQKGLRDPQAVQEYLTTDAGKTMINQVYNSMPQIQQVPDQSRIIDAITQGAYKAIGETDVNFVNNPGYIDPYEAARIGKLGGGMGGAIVNTGKIESIPEMSNILTNRTWSKQVDPIVQQEAARLGIPNIKTYEDLVRFKKENSSPLGAKPFASDLRDKRAKAVEAIKNIENVIGEHIKNNKEMFADDVYQFNLLGARSNEERTQLESYQKQLDSHVSNIPKGNLVGIDESNSRLLKDWDKFSDITVRSFSFYPTNNPASPLGTRLQLTATKGSGVNKEKVDIDAKVNDTALNQQSLLAEFFMDKEPMVIMKYLSAKEGLIPTKDFDALLTRFGITREQYNNSK